MPVPRRLIAALFALLPLALQVPAASGQTLPTRLNIDLVYAQSSDPVLERRVKAWVSALQEKVQTSLGWNPDLRLPLGGKILVSPAPQPTVPPAAMIEQRWRNRNAIQIVVGHGERNGAQSAFQGSIYLGQLRGRLPIAIPIAQAIEGQSYERSSNFVLVVALYALSVDAAAVPATSCQLLRSAARLGSRLPATLTSAATVNAGIMADLRARCGGAGT